MKSFLVGGTLFAAMLVTVACAHGTSPPTATPSATQPPATTPTAGADGFRAFARQIDQAVVARDTTFFRQHMKTIHVDCRTVTDANQLGGTDCATPDAAYEGFGTAPWRTDGGGIHPADAAVTIFQRVFDEQLAGDSDDYGSGAARVYALNVEDGRYWAIIAALITRPSNFAGSGPLRIALATSWLFEDGQWRTDGLVSAYVLAEDFLNPNPEAQFDAWERFEPP